MGLIMGGGTGTFTYTVEDLELCLCGHQRYMHHYHRGFSVHEMYIFPCSRCADDARTYCHDFEQGQKILI